MCSASRIKEYTARIIKNPKTDDIANVPSKKIAVFKDGEELRIMVDG